MKKVIIIILIAAFIILVAVFAVVHYLKYVSFPRDKTGMLNEHRVYCNEQFFQAENRDYLYEPGATVQLLFPLPAADVEYSFQVTGVDHFDTSFDPQKGYIIQFEMPNNYVSVDYRVEEPFEGIAISLYENPSTGFEWTCKTSPQGILSLVEDRYESDPYDADEPIDGLGGTHHWKFKVVKSGTVVMTFKLLRGNELLETVTYKYKCDGTNGTFAEVQ